MDVLESWEKDNHWTLNRYKDNEKKVLERAAVQEEKTYLTAEYMNQV
jgi:hypothetical protein